jgi:acetate kinase
LDFENSKIVTCHIGNGGSVTAVLNGKSVDTSMGLTPVDGLMMGTRCGSIDPGVLNFIHQKEGKSMEEIWNLINKESGIYGLSGGLSSDMRDIKAAADAGNTVVAEAQEAYFYRVRKLVGSYAAAMGGLDLVVFTGGVGENGPEMREYVCGGLEFMGIEFDAEANRGVKGQDKVLSTPTSRVKVVVIGTNEELVIATDTYNIVSKL